MSRPNEQAGDDQECILVFAPEFLDDLRFWVQTNRKIALHVLDLIEASRRDPMHGIGQPEPLKHELQGAWSRRITQEHRLVYLPSAGRIDFLQCRYHY